MATETLAWEVLADDRGASRVFNTVSAAMAGASKASKALAAALKIEEAASGSAAKGNLTLAKASQVLADSQAKMAGLATAAAAAMNAEGDAAAESAAKLSAVSAEYKGLTAQMTAAAAAAKLDAAALNAQGDAAAGSAIKIVAAGQGLKSTINLFGGAGFFGIMKTVGAWHLLADSVIETTAVVLPATVATIAFGAAAGPAVSNVVHQFTNLYTVSKALGTEIYPLTGGFSRLAAAAQPRVYQLLGDALVVLNSRSGELTKLVQGAGLAFDQLGARATAALVSSGASVFLKNAVGDLSQIGTVVGNIFGIAGNLLKTMPGYAEKLLSLLQDVTHGLEVVTGSGAVQQVIHFGLAFHGAALYIGLAGTLLGRLVQSGLGGAATLFTKAGLSLLKMGSAGAAAGEGLGLVAKWSEKAAGLPWGWIAGAAVGLGVLAYQLLHVKDATQQWIAAQQSILNATPAVKGLTLAYQDLGTDAAKVTAAQKALNAVSSQGTLLAQRAAHDWSRIPGAVAPAINSYNELSGTQQVLQGQIGVYRANLANLGKQFGGTAHAQLLLTQAGITWGQITTRNKAQLASIVLQMQATDAAFKAMALGTGREAAAMNALNISEGTGATQMSVYLAQMTKIVTAQDQVTTIVAGSEQAFVALAQGLDQTSKDAAKTGASLSGLGKNSLTLRNDFWSTLIPAGQKLIDTLNLQDASTGRLTTAVATLTGRMLPYTKSNEAAKAMLVSLINNALGPGTVSLKTLDKWVGQNSTSMQGFSRIVDAATIKAGTLAGILQKQLNVQFHEDLLQVTGANAALKTYTADLAANTETTSKGRSDRAQLIRDLVNSGLGAKQARAYVDSLTTSLHKVPGHVTTSITAIASGHGSIAEYAKLAGQNKQTGYLEFHAAGGLITGGTPGRDSVLSALTPGEVVVPAPMVAAGAVDHLRGKLPGFAAGGLVGHPSLPESSMTHAVGTFFARALHAYMSAAITAAAKAVTVTPTGALGGDPAVNRALAQRLFPWPAAMFPAFDSLEMAEAGYNRFARNPSTGAYGMPQALPPTKMPYAAQAAGGSHAEPQLAWMWAYIAQRYRNPIAAWSHEQAFHWYGGGLDAVFRKPTLIGVGDGGPERVRVTPLRGGGTQTVNYITLNVSVGHGTHPTQAAKEIAAVLNHGAKHGIKLRKSIIATSG